MVVWQQSPKQSLNNLCFDVQLGEPNPLLSIGKAHGARELANEQVLSNLYSISTGAFAN